MTARSIELRSDTFTRPTPSMRRAMYEAEVGDDVWGEDPTVKLLEERAAEVLGKEAAVFVSSGTQANLVAVLSHTKPSDEVLVGDESHVFWYEVAGTAVVGGIQLRTLHNDERGKLDPEEIAASIRGENIHFPDTGCLVLENTHNRCGGAALRREEIAAMAIVATEAGVPVHIDGARIFNAAIAVKQPAAELASPADSVSFCLTKGLGAPVGSLVCGPAEYVAQARHWRKLLGGGMRQVGVLAAAGLVALDENIDRLAEDHANARLLAEGLATIPGIEVHTEGVDTNIVVADVAQLGLEVPELLGALAEEGVRISSIGGTRVRAVTSYEVSREDILHALSAISKLANQKIALTV